MRIILHAGVQCTDDERLIKTLLRNKDTFTKAGVAVPPPKLYRNLLRKALIKGLKYNLDNGDREHLLETILEGKYTQINTVILSNPMFIGIPRELLGSVQLYPNAVRVLEQFLLLFFLRMTWNCISQFVIRRLFYLLFSKLRNYRNLAHL